VGGEYSALNYSTYTTGKGVVFRGPVRGVCTSQGVRSYSATRGIAGAGIIQIMLITSNVLCNVYNGCTLYWWNTPLLA
jgi:hypothetical protein